MKLHIGLESKVAKTISESLLDYLATTYALYLKTQNFHWNLQGTNFYSLHLLFEKQYEEMAEAVDELAERIRALGSYVDGSFTSFHKRSKISDANKPLPQNEMIAELLDGHETLSKMGRPLIRKFQELSDDVSSDLLIKRLSFHEKSAWMLRSHLEK